MRYLLFFASMLATLPGLAEQQCDPEVTASTPTSAFDIQPGGIALDTRSGLIWQRCLVGQEFDDGGTPGDGSDDQCLGEPSTIDLNDAAAYATDGWRLPAIEELQALVEAACSDPAINITVFPDDPGKFVWSSTPYPGPKNFTGGGNWGIYFSFDDTLVRGESTGRVRLVRDNP